ncbi:MAG: hypothetical protein O9332_24925 [Microcystis sp. LE19-10.1B]|uniref:hypothetical protein n=1 Tax=Microcystis sp. LE19-10.1B TaxID=3016428 RepID=UPI0022C3B998|nr:hypothetical protein [Microcystis sp. LE19-10.1B]MCZ8028539.1 hypothetical protein [Microcystis sp. LE19-10.1B]MCZ8365080.1 hypothetical protein [Microcystis sp. LE19-251.1A]
MKFPHFPTSPRNAHEVVSPFPHSPTPHTLHPTPSFKSGDSIQETVFRNRKLNT